MENQLVSLYTRHSGKTSDKWSIYLEVYNRLFSEFKSKSIALLEIGIQNGGSLELWAQYFVNARKIVGCDINEMCRNLNYKDTRISVVVGDANTSEVELLVDTIQPEFHIIIDDGSHTSSDIVKSFARYFPKLLDDGLFVVEDLHCAYWAQFEGGLFDPQSSISFFKRLADVINFEHWGVKASREAVIRSFSNSYGIQINEELLAHIHSVEFYNSVCVVRKKTPASNVLGARVVVGEVAAVERLVAQSGSTSVPADQSANPWSVADVLPEDELRRLTVQAVDLKRQLSILEAQVADERHHRDLTQARAKVWSSYANKLSLDLADHRRALANQHGALSQLRDELQQMQDLAQLRLASIQELWHSTSWRATGPIRWGGLQLSRIRRIAQLMPTLRRQAGGYRALTARAIGTLRDGGVPAVKAALRSAENHRRVPLAVPALAAERDSSDVMEVIALSILKAQQAELQLEDVPGRLMGFGHKPLISIIMPVYKTPVKWLVRVIESLQEQHYPNWELCAVDDCSPTNEQRRVLEDFAARDPRVRFQVLASNGGISTASNASLDMAQGEYVALVDHDDELPPDALFWVVNAINENPDGDFFYTDECKIDDTPARRMFHFIFKPDWSPEWMFNAMLTSHLTVYRKEVVESVGGFRSAYDFSQDYDLALRIGEVARKVVHIERVLYFWRSIPGSAASGGKDFARETNIAALDDAVVRRGILGAAIPLPRVNYVNAVVPEGALVSIVIPSDSYDNIRLALDAIHATTDFQTYEVLVVCNGPLAARLRDYYDSAHHIRFVEYNKRYNFSDKCNEGARAAKGEILVFYNDDVFPIQRDWVQKLVEYLYVKGVGGVSPKLLHQNGTIQYAGMIAGTPGLCGTAYNNIPCDADDSFLSQHKFVRNVSVLSGACCALKTKVFWDVGGFDAENTPDGHSDVDLSFRLLRAGYRCVYTPHSLLYHVGNHSWGAKSSKYKADIHMLKRWGTFLSRDPNFTDTMKKVLYGDFRFEYKIYASHIDPLASYSGPDVLIVVSTLQAVCDARVALDAAKFVIDAGGFAVVSAPEDGPIRFELEAAGAVVIVDASLPTKHFLFERFARNFDVVVVVGGTRADIVETLDGLNVVDIVWWLPSEVDIELVRDQEPPLELKRTTLLVDSEPARQRLREPWNAAVGHERESFMRQLAQFA